MKIEIHKGFFFADVMCSRLIGKHQNRVMDFFIGDDPGGLSIDSIAFPRGNLFTLLFGITIGERQYNGKP